MISVIAEEDDEVWFGWFVWLGIDGDPCAVVAGRPDGTLQHPSKALHLEIRETTPSYILYEIYQPVRWIHQRPAIMTTTAT